MLDSILLLQLDSFQRGRLLSNQALLLRGMRAHQLLRDGPLPTHHLRPLLHLLLRQAADRVPLDLVVGLWTEGGGAVMIHIGGRGFARSHSPSS